VICAHPVGSWTPVCALEHLLEQMFQLDSRDVVVDLIGGVLDPVVLPAGVNFLHQRDDLMGQPVGDLANSS
jgi:hypothetical protein